MTVKTKPSEAGGKEGVAITPSFTRTQLISAKRFEHSRDMAAAVLAGGENYTMDQAEKLVRAFLERKVK